MFSKNPKKFAVDLLNFIGNQAQVKIFDTHLTFYLAARLNYIFLMVYLRFIVSAFVASITSDVVRHYRFWSTAAKI